MVDFVGVWMGDSCRESLNLVGSGPLVEDYNRQRQHLALGLHPPKLVAMWGPGPAAKVIARATEDKTHRLVLYS